MQDDSALIKIKQIKLADGLSQDQTYYKYNIICLTNQLITANLSGLFGMSGWLYSDQKTKFREILVASVSGLDKPLITANLAEGVSQGDRGGPLTVMTTDNRYFLIGILVSKISGFNTLKNDMQFDAVDYQWILQSISTHHPYD